MAITPSSKTTPAATGEPAPTQSGRVYNFNPGPATLPLAALEEAQRDLLCLPGEGMSVLELSHRSKRFEAIIGQAEANLRKLLNIPENYRVLFLQGGATLQFSMVPMNLLPKDGSADYIVTGHWSKNAVKEAQKVGRVNIAATTEAEKFARLPRPDEFKLDPRAAYVHFTSNNTIYGTQWLAEPEVGDVPLVCDASSDICSRPLDLRRYALIYAGAQKNLGPAGVTLVILRDDLLAPPPAGRARTPPGLPAMLDYKTLAEKKSLYNTPPVFAIYMLELVTRWLLTQGGLAAAAKANERKAALVYDAIDSSNGFYRGTADKASRSRMNITFRLPTEELEAKFLKEAAGQGLHGLKGHRSVGGCRASMFNAFPLAGAQALADFMKDFARRHP
ncbi:MAG: 3-phosphoserine/phosphohydroxythreonine transaminase [Terriglobia bacterium]